MPGNPEVNDAVLIASQTDQWLADEITATENYLEELREEKARRFRLERQGEWKDPGKLDPYAIIGRPVVSGPPL